MENKGFSLALVVGIGILLGVIIISVQQEGALLNELLSRQAIMLSSQKRIESKMLDGQNISSKTEIEFLSRQITVLLDKQKGLETRLAQLESRPAPAVQRMEPPQPAVAQQGPDPTKPQNIPVDHSYVFGKKDAPVTIVEFVDFQCPFCARFHTPMAEAVVAYPDKAKYVIKHFPLSFHQQAKPAAKAALAAGEQGKFFEMAQVLLQNGMSLTDETFEKSAKDIGLNVKKFMKDYKERDSEWEALIEKDITLGGNVGVRGTPTFFINGKITQTRDVGGWKRDIEAEANMK